jgi:hypothetical protein
MSTLSGAIANKLMTNTWLDDKISPKYTTFPFLTFNITWKLTYGTTTTTKTCKYNAIGIDGDDRIIYGITDWTHNAGVTDSNFSTNKVGHSEMAAWGNVLSKFYLPIVNDIPSIEFLLALAKFPITEVHAHLGNLPIGTYKLSQIQSAISSMGTIDISNSKIMASVEKYIYKVSNGGVEYGGNKINYDGTPPSVITPYIEGEANSSKRVITYKDYNNIFTGTSGDSLKCVREDVNDFNEVIYYAVPGMVYTAYYGPGHASNVRPLHGVDLNQTSSVTIIPPTMTGLQKWNKENTGLDDATIIPVLNLNRGGLDKQINIGNGNNTKLNALNIFWNFEDKKTTYIYATTAFFGKCTRLDNDGSGALLGQAGTNPMFADKDIKIYPGDIFGRQPYMTPSILQDSPYDIYKVSYLPFSTAIQYYKHPTMNRSLTSSDGLDYKTIGGNSYAVIPVIYIPSTISMISATGSCNVTLTTTTTYPTVNISFTSNRQFYIYKYAYGNLSFISGNNASQRVHYNEIFDMSAFLNQLNTKSNFTGTMNYTQLNSEGYPRSHTLKFTPKVTFTASSDSSGNLLLTANAQNYSSEPLYNGYLASATTIGTSEIRFNSVDIDGFLIGVVSSYERTTNTSFAVWTGTGGTSSASLTNVIGDFDYE